MEGFSYRQLKPLAAHCLKKGQSVIAFGPPGVGKTTMALELASEVFNLPLIDLRVGQREPSEIGGFGYPNKETMKVDWYAPDWFPTEPSFIFLDEINCGTTKQHQSALYQIMLDKGIGKYKFPEGSVIMGAGNNAEDHSIVTELSAALENRCSTFQHIPDVEDWLYWAEKAGISADYRAYIAFGREKALFEYTGQHAFPSPRSNASAARLVDGVENESMRKKLAASAIGEAHATKYMTFLKVYKNINIKDVIDKGIMPEINDNTEESFLYAFVYSMASHISVPKPSQLQGAKAENIVKVIKMFSSKPEYQSTFFRMLIDMIGKKKGIFDILRTVPDFGPLASHLSTILSADAC